MRKLQPSMKPIDVVVLVKLCLEKELIIQAKISKELYISQSEISKSMVRLRFAGLIFGEYELQILRQEFFEFLKYGIRFTFPQQAGSIATGIPTAHSAEPLVSQISGVKPYVWPSAVGTVRGRAIPPLYPNAVYAAIDDTELYEVLVLIDALRVGRDQDRYLAAEELKKRIC